jgi:hypothetical protein
LCGEILSLLDSFDDVLVKPFVLDGAVEAFDIGVLLGLAGLDIMDGNPLFLGPFQLLGADLFRVAIHPYHAKLSPPFNDAIKAPDHTLGRQGKVHLYAQPLTVDVVQHVQQPKLATIP